MNIYQKLNAVMRDVTGVGKHSKNNHQNYKYAGHEAVTEALRGSYVTHGIVRTASVVRSHLDDKTCCYTADVDVSWVNIENPDDRLTVRMTGLAPSTSSKGPQAAATQAGVALSYAVKLAEFKVLALTGDDTPDAASEETTRGEERSRHAPVNVEALARAISEAQNERDFQAAIEAVRKVVVQLTEEQRAALIGVRDSKIASNGWKPR